MRTIAILHLPAVLILLEAVAALSVPVSLATREMESPVQVWACILRTLQHSSVTTALFLYALLSVLILLVWKILGNYELGCTCM